MTDTLKSICEQCIHLQNPQLNFIPQDSQRQREIIIRDLTELVSAASAEQEKTVVILAGSLLEAILYSFIQTQTEFIRSRVASFTFEPNGKLREYVSTFNNSFSDVLSHSIPDIAVHYRNLVHINRELRSPSDICSRAAPEMLRLLDALLEKLTMYAET